MAFVSYKRTLASVENLPTAVENNDAYLISKMTMYVWKKKECAEEIYEWKMYARVIYSIQTLGSYDIQ